MTKPIMTLLHKIDDQNLNEAVIAFDLLGWEEKAFVLGYLGDLRKQEGNQ